MDTQTPKINVNTANGQGQNAIGAFDPSAFGSTWQQGNNTLFGNQEKTQNDYLSAFKNQIANQPSATQYYNQGNEMFNVPELTGYANTLRNAVLTAPQTTLDSAKGFNYDNNQVTNQTNLTLGRLSPLAQSATNQAQTAQGLASGYANAGIQQNAMNIVPFQAQGQMLDDLFSRQATGFTAANESTLNGLVSKMQSGVGLSEQEMQTYAQLSSQEEAYQQQKLSSTASQNIAKIQSGNQILSPGQTYYNPFTAQTYNPFVNVGS